MRVGNRSRSPLVVDSSAMVAALIASRRPGADRPLIEDVDLIDVEVLHVLRRISVRGHLSEEQAADAPKDFCESSPTDPT